MPSVGLQVLARVEVEVPQPADEAEQRVSQLSRAYRVNLTVLALVALFVGAFLVFSVVSLSVAQRTPSLALLGVLGLTARERRQLVLLECGLLGAVGSAIGLLLGTGMAAAALRLRAGDPGGGHFAGIGPPLPVPYTTLPRPDGDVGEDSGAGGSLQKKERGGNSISMKQ